MKDKNGQGLLPGCQIFAEFSYFGLNGKTSAKYVPRGYISGSVLRVQTTAYSRHVVQILENASSILLTTELQRKILSNIQKFPGILHFNGRNAQRPHDQTTLSFSIAF